MNTHNYRALIQSLDDLIFLIDENYLFVDVWISDENLLFMPKAQIIGQSFKQILPPTIAELLQIKILLTIEQKKSQTFEYQNPFIQDLDQSPWYRCRVTQTQLENKIYFTAVIADISVQKRIEFESQKQINEINELKKKISKNIEVFACCRV